MIVTKRGKIYVEGHSHIDDISKWPEPVGVQAMVELREDDVGCDWGNSEESRRRKAFCKKYEGYGSVCHCKYPRSGPAAYRFLHS